MSKFVSPDLLQKSLKAMAILDIILNDEEDFDLRIINGYKNEEVYDYIFDNGSGDRLNVMLTKNSSFIKGFDHENTLNQYGNYIWDNSFFENMFANAPKELLDTFSKGEKDETTFAMWNLDNSDNWIENPVPNNDGGKKYLLDYICLSAKDWIKLASDYYEMDFDIDYIQYIYNGNDIDERIIKSINPERDVNLALEEIYKLI